jgi:hypothetical protein
MSSLYTEPCSNHDTTTEVPPSSNGSNGAAVGRDRRGRFVRGNPGGPGNPFGRKVAALRAALIDCITPQDLQRVMGVLLLEAVNGSIPAARLLLAYTVGKPAAPADPDRVEIDEWQLLKQTVAPQNDVAQTFQSVPVELASKLANATLPVLADEMGDQLAARLSVPVPGSEKRVSDDENTLDEDQLEADWLDNELMKDKAMAAAPSPTGANGPKTPSPTGANGQAAPSPAGANGQGVKATTVGAAEIAPPPVQPPSAAPAPVSLATMRRLASLSRHAHT